MTIADIVIVGLLGLLILLEVSPFHFFNMESKNKKENEKATEAIDNYSIAILMKEKSYAALVDKIDEFVLHAIDQYLTLQVRDTEFYFDTPTIKEFETYVHETVKLNITPALRKYISIFYNYKTEDELMRFIKLREKIHITNVVVANNTPIQK